MFCSPSPLLLCLLGCERAVFGLRYEVVPAVDRECLEGPVRTLSEYVVGGVLRHTALLLTFESATRKHITLVFTGECYIQLVSTEPSIT